MATKKTKSGGSFGFLQKFREDVVKMGDVGTDSIPPTYWFSTGNYVQNYVMSGSFRRAIPQGRIVTFAGPSGSGKSFNIASSCAAAQREKDAFILVVDTENALDDDYMRGCGVDVSNERYMYTEVSTIAQCIAVVGTFIKQYRDEYEGDPDAPPVVIVIDSLDMLMTETELENYNKNIQKGDQGQRNKQFKAMLRNFTNDIKYLNVTIITASQVYKNQDVTNGEGLWIVSDAVKYAASIIVMVTKLKLKKDAEIRGIRMKTEGYKTRFTKPFQSVTIEVDYETGVDPYSGLADVAVGLGVLVKAGARLKFAHDETLPSFYEKNIGENIELILTLLEAELERRKASGESTLLDADLTDKDEDRSIPTESATARRKRLADEKNGTAVVEAT